MTKGRTTSGDERLKEHYRKLIAADGRQGGGARRLVACPGGIEEVQKQADNPISCRNPKGERRHDGQQEQGG